MKLGLLRLISHFGIFLVDILKFINSQRRIHIRNRSHFLLEFKLKALEVKIFDRSSKIRQKYQSSGLATFLFSKSLVDGSTILSQS